MSDSVRLETSSRTCLCSLAVTFCLSVGLFVFGGIEYGPKVYRSKLVGDRSVMGKDEFKWDIKMNSMTEKHRDLEVAVEFKAKHIRQHFAGIAGGFGTGVGSLTSSRPWAGDEIYHVASYVSVYGIAHKLKYRLPTSPKKNKQILKDKPTDLEVHCYEQKEWCEPAVLLNFERVIYGAYNIETRFDSKQFGKAITEAKFYVRYGNANETNYLIIFKYLFVIASSLFCIWYTCAIDKVPDSMHTTEQQFLQALVVLLIFFNDPLYLAEVEVGWVVFPILSVVFHTSFIAYLLLFWLVLLDHIRLQAREQRINKRSFYPAKAIFVAVFWLLSVLVYCYNIEELSLNPAFKTKYNSTAYLVFKIGAVVAMVAYLVWIFVMSVLLFAEIRSMNYRFQFILLFSFVMALLTIAGVLLSYHQLAHPNMGEWTGFYAIFNFYTFTLGYLYSPAPREFNRQQYDGVELMGMGDKDGGEGDDLDLEMSLDGFDQMGNFEIGSPTSANDDGEFSGRLSPGTLALAGELVGDDRDDIEDFDALDTQE